MHRFRPISERSIKDRFFGQFDYFVYFIHNLIMRTVSATHAKQNFAEVIDAAQREPVRIRRHNRDLAVMISAEEYDRMVSDRWREFDRFAALAAAQAKAAGLTEEKLQEILAER
jgi:prevent-host-death family protein